MKVLEEIQRSFREYTGPGAGAIAAVVLVLAALVLAAVLIRHYASPAARAARRRLDLFRSIAVANQLSLVERETLLRVARHYEIEDPIQLFVKRSLFEAAVPALKLDSETSESIRKKLYV
ncbi:MAG: hypothetical protein HYY17_10575 [Planctomycetes bacterium]|nr:hypothetical protein [Planctomycetota bacterium]